MRDDAVCPTGARQQASCCARAQLRQHRHSALPSSWCGRRLVLEGVLASDILALLPGSGVRRPTEVSGQHNTRCERAPVCITRATKHNTFVVRGCAQTEAAQGVRQVVSDISRRMEETSERMWRRMAGPAPRRLHAASAFWALRRSHASRGCTPSATSARGTPPATLRPRPAG